MIFTSRIIVKTNQHYSFLRILSLYLCKPPWDMALLLSGYYCCHLFDVTKYQHKYAEVRSILRIHLASKCAMFGLTLPKLFSKLICMTSFPWYWLKPQTAEKFYLTFLFMMNHIKSLIWIWQTRLNFTSVQWVYHLPRYKTFLKYGCWLLSFQYCYIRLWVWIQLDEYLSFSWHNMSSFGN